VARRSGRGGVIRKDRTGVNASLVLVKADGGQKEVPLRSGTSVVGRETDAQIRIPAGGVSRRHCEFRVEDGEIVLRDLGSRNGTYVNGEKVEERALKAGDAIAIDEFVFVLRLDGKPAAIDASARSRALPAVDESDDSFFGPVGKPGASAGSGGMPAGRPAPGKKGSGDSSVGGFDFDDLLDDEKDMPKL
jgi:hypothetical protein